MSTHAPRKRVIATLIIFILLIIAFALYQKKATSEQTTRKLNHATETSTDSTLSTDTLAPLVYDQPTIGRPQANLHIVAFEDLKCTGCKYFMNHVFPQIKSQLIDTGKAQYTVVTLAFISGSTPAGNAALCIAKQSTTDFFAFLKVVYANQPDERLDWATKPTLLDFAKQVPGVNISKLTQCIDNHTYDTQLQDNLSIASIASKNQIQTPMIFVNGERLDYSNAAIEALLNH